MTSLRSAARRVIDTVRGSGALWTASLVLDRIVPFGVLGLWPDKTVAPEALARQVDAILRSWGMSPEHASITIEHLLYADLHGIDSHGCSMLLHYHRGLLAGSLAMTPTIAVVRESATTALVDGGGGLGHVPGDMAMKLAMAKCRESGLGAAAVRNSGHYGAAGAYASMAAQSGYIGIATTNTLTPAVVPTFGAEATLGTNPIAFAAPAARNPPFVLDMATSTASLGTLTMAWRKGRSIPVGWALAANGAPVTNGRRAAMQRRLTPLGSSREMGSHKGYGLAVAVEILSSVLPGLRSGTQLKNVSETLRQAQGEAKEPAARGSAHAEPVAAGDSQQPGAGVGVGHFFLAIDPRRFRDPGEFEADLDGLIDALHACPSLSQRQPVLVAGDPEHAAFAERRRSGIPLSRSVIEDIRTVARASGVPFTLDTNE